MVLAITRRQILATLGGQFKTVLDRIGWCHRVCGAASWMWLRIPSQHLEKKEQGASPAPKIVSTLFPANLDLILIAGLTLLVRVRAPPETWTTRPQPSGSA
jgi:hypothetical protein